MDVPVLPLSAARTRFQMRLEVLDRPGVLAKVATLFGTHQVSIESVRQPPRPVGAPLVQLIIGTHEATEAALEATVAEIRECDVVNAVLSVLRVEGE
jgi:homoserine dehydrogenase